MKPKFALYDPAVGDLLRFGSDGTLEGINHFYDSTLAEKWCKENGYTFTDCGTIPNPTPEQLAVFSNKLRRIRGIK